MGAIMAFQVEQTCCVNDEIPFEDVVAPDNVMNTPGMLSRKERRLLYSLGKSVYTGRGVVVDAGSFMGASCVGMAQGIMDNQSVESSGAGTTQSQRKLIYGYELGVMPAPSNGQVKHKQFGDVNYEFGTSFVHVLKENIAPFKHMVQMNVGDLLEQTWQGGPIEICFLDVCKSVELNQHVNKQFLPHLIPGVSRLIQQDFYFDRLPWCKVTMGYLSEYFEWQGQAMSSAIYKLMKPIPEDVLNYDPFTQGSLKECLRYHDMHEQTFHDDRDRMLLGLSRAFLMALKGDKQGALSYLKRVKRSYGDCFEDPVRGEMNAIRYNRTVQQIRTGFILNLWGEYKVQNAFHLPDVKSMMQGILRKRLHS
ncbi:methyltransferase FkbM [Pseudovibrio sp. FO-BEG1]|nr:methyltransferase FkbM [Pseudovibrio sp. FO-BEG1]